MNLGLFGDMFWWFFLTVVPCRHKKDKKRDKEREKDRDRERKSDKDRGREERERSTSKKKKSKDKERDREKKSDGEKGDVKVDLLYIFSIDGGLSNVPPLWPNLWLIYGVSVWGPFPVLQKW